MRGNRKGDEPGQALVLTLILGTVIGIFALTVAYMLVRELKDTRAVLSRAEDVHLVDGVVDRAINILKEGDNWGLAPSIPNYCGDYVFQDFEDVEYTVRIDRGSLVEPPGSDKADRTITIYLRQMPDEKKIPEQVEALPTFEAADMAPEDYGYRKIQAVISRRKFTHSVSGKSGIGMSGKALVWWGNVYNFDEFVDMEIGNKANHGPGYPEYYSMTDIVWSGHGTYNDCGQEDYLYPQECKTMPKPPRINEGLLKSRARNMINWEGTGTAYDGKTPPIQGFFFYWDDFDYPPDADEIKARVDAYETVRGIEPDPADSVIFVDTTDGFPAADDESNFQTINLSQAKLRGSVIIMGHVDMNASENQGYTPAIDFEAPTGMGAGNVPWEPPTGHPDTLDRTPNINGLLYVRGDFGWAGGPVIYGAVICDGAFDAAGGIEVWYRYDFPYEGVMGGQVAVTRWREVHSKYRVPTPTPTPAP